MHFIPVNPLSFYMPTRGEEVGPGYHGPSSEEHGVRAASTTPNHGDYMDGVVFQEPQGKSPVPRFKSCSCPREPNRKYCLPCLTNKRRELVAELSSQGICLRCHTSPAAADRKECLPCLRYGREAKNRRDAERLSRGLCVKCSSLPRHRNRKRCLPCLEQEKETRWKREAAFSSRGVCIKCQSSPAATGLRVCLRCREATSSYNRAYKRKRLAERRSLGLCISCDSPSDKRQLCGKCRANLKTNKQGAHHGGKQTELMSPEAQGQTGHRGISATSITIPSGQTETARNITPFQQQEITTPDNQYAKSPPSRFLRISDLLNH
ncbi:hypothetical protein F4802DRAFT_232245 [Xylaria palmicola]|nr:hypothetical protein F4802DRAFT_232245 [Xylaria palmicola]